MKVYWYLTNAASHKSVVPVHTAHLVPTPSPTKPSGTLTPHQIEP